MTRKPQILIIGNNENGCTPELEKIAYNTGTEVAKAGAILVTGGLGGVMEAVVFVEVLGYFEVAVAAYVG